MNLLKTKNETEKFHIFSISTAMHEPTKNEKEKFHIFSISTAMHEPTKNEKRNGKISHFLDINSNARTY